MMVSRKLDGRGMAVGSVMLLVAASVTLAVLDGVSSAESQAEDGVVLNEKLTSFNGPGPDWRRGEVAVSPDSTHVAYPVGGGGPEYKQVMIRDGERGLAYEWVRSPVFSPDSKHLAYFVTKHGKELLVLDGREAKVSFEFVGIFAALPIFSPDSRRVAYIIIPNGGWRVVVDGKAGKAFEWVSKPVFSPDSSRVVYIASKKDDYFAVVDGKVFGPFDGCGDPVFSPDSKHLAYSVWKGDKCVMTRDGEEGAAYDAIYPFSYRFSPDSARLAYCAKKGREWMLVVDEEEAPVSYHRVREPVFSPDSSRVAYMAWPMEQIMVIVDGQEQRRFRGLKPFSLLFSPDSKRFAFGATAKDGESLAVIDGKGGSTYDRDWASCRPVFSPDSARTAYVGKKEGKWVVVVDGEEGDAYDDVWSVGASMEDLSKFAAGALAGMLDEPMRSSENYWHTVVFSPDSKHFAYVAKRHGEWFLVVDGKEAKNKFWTLLSKPAFYAPDSLRFVGARLPGPEFFRVDVRIETLSKKVE